MGKQLSGVYDGSMSMVVMAGVRPANNPHKAGKACFICRQPIAIGDAFYIRFTPQPKLIWHQACE
jgi:hypothetical protein